MNGQNLEIHRNKHVIYAGICIGIIIGTLSFFSMGSTFVFFVAFAFGLLIWFRVHDPSEKKFLLTIFVIGFLSRICCVLLTNYGMALLGKHYTWYGERSIDIFSDSAYYVLRSWRMARYYQGEQFSQILLRKMFYSQYGPVPYLYMMSFFQYIFGFSSVALKFVNCFFGVSTGIVTYFMVKEIFSVKIAKLSAIFVVFFPSMFLWSLSNLKDTGMVFTISVALWSFVNFQKKRKLCYFLFLVISMGFLLVFPQASFSILLWLVMLFSYFCSSNSRGIKKITILFVAIIFLQSFLYFKYDESIKSIFSKSLKQIINVHRGQIFTTPISGGFFYKILDEKYYSVDSNGCPPDVIAGMNLTDYVKMLTKGWVHCLFEPFPWKIYSKSLLLSCLQMGLWYFLMPFVFLGMIIAARCHWYLSCILFFYLFTFVTLLALSGGNIGTVFRHRDMVTPIILVFASVGLARTYGNTR